MCRGSHPSSSIQGFEENKFELLGFFSSSSRRHLTRDLKNRIKEREREREGEDGALRGSLLFVFNPGFIGNVYVGTGSRARNFLTRGGGSISISIYLSLLSPTYSWNKISSWEIFLLLIRSFINFHWNFFERNGETSGAKLQLHACVRDVRCNKKKLFSPSRRIILFIDRQTRNQGG